LTNNSGLRTSRAITQSQFSLSTWTFGTWYGRSIGC
jgi:hypothetical protein